MHQHPCIDVRERLEAFYDGELAVDERIAIQNHLGECVACTLATEELGMLGASLRASSELEKPRATCSRHTEALTHARSKE